MMDSSIFASASQMCQKSEPYKEKRLIYCFSHIYWNAVLLGVLSV